MQRIRKPGFFVWTDLSFTSISEEDVIQSVTQAAWKIENPSTTAPSSQTYDFLGRVVRSWVKITHG